MSAGYSQAAPVAAPIVVMPPVGSQRRWTENRTIAIRPTQNTGVAKATEEKSETAWSKKLSR